MATYNLNAADLITLLQTTVQESTGGTILGTLIADKEYPGPIGTGQGVQTILGPSGSTADATTQSQILGSGIKFELITLPTSTSNPNATLTSPTVGTQTTASNFNFLSNSGGVVIGAGDQFVSVDDFNSGSVADTLIGGAYKEKLTSGAGSNELIAGTGANTLQGGAGADTLIGGGATRLLAGTGANMLIGGTILGAHDTLLGGAGKDTLKVTEGSNRLTAGSGSNSLYGGSGTDTLVGAAGASMVGGSGAQRLIAEGGAETLVAGGGSDTLVATSTTSSITATTGSGYTLFRDVIASGSSQLGASATITGGTGASHLVLGSTGTDSILSGAGAINILSTQTLANLTSNTDSGATHTLKFSNGQTIVVNDVNADVTIHFTGGGSTPV